MPEYLNYFPQPLLTDLVMGRWLPIVGAGMSKNAIVPVGKSIPLWDELGKILSSEIASFPFTNAIDAISSYSHEYSRSKLVERLIDLLLVDEAKPGSAHESFCNIPFDVVVTTNFDFLLEHQYIETPRYCKPIIDEGQLSISSKRSHVTLLKMHGDLHHPQRLVVTEDDYDTFLDRYPLLATYLSSLLIARTAVMIGYSLEDPDFRHVWQILADRLGKSRRSAYAIVVDASSAEIARFDRRGVKVINLPGNKSNYAKILTDTFNELRSYWTNNVLSASTITEEDPLRELSLPARSSKRLCYFSVPTELLSFYKDQVFPIAQQLGFVPITIDDIVLPRGNINATIEALIDRAQIVVIDATSPATLIELRLILSKYSPNRRLLIISDRESRYIGEFRYGSDFLNLLPSHSSIFTIRKSGELYASEATDEYEGFLAHVESWFQSVAERLNFNLFDEPVRLMEVQEYRAAVISAMSLLENELRKRVQLEEPYQTKRSPFIKLFRMAVQLDLLDHQDDIKVQKWTTMRNKAVHEGLQISKRQAQEVVDGARRIIERLGEQRNRN